MCGPHLTASTALSGRRGTLLTEPSALRILCLQVPVNSRGHVWASFDSKHRTEWAPGDAAD
jgi:hypothetical protein